MYMSFFPPREEGGGARDPIPSSYNQGSPSKLIVIDNQIFSASHSVEPHAKVNEEIEVVGKCYKEERYGDELPCHLPSHLSVRDMVTIFERRSHDEGVSQDVCKTQESINIQSVRKKLVEKWNDSVIGKECQKSNGDPETRKDNGGESALKRGEDCSSGRTPFEVPTREQTGSQRPLHTVNFSDMKLSKFSDKEAGSWNPLYQDSFEVPRNTSFWMACTPGKLSRSYVVKETSDLSLQGSSALPHQRSSYVSKPSEERVKKFLERYYEKREKKLQTRLDVEKEKAAYSLTSAQLFLDKEQASKHDSDNAFKKSRGSAQGGKPEMCKESPTNCRKSKGMEDQRGPNELQHCRKDSISTGTTANSCIKEKSSHSIRKERSTSRLSSAKLPAPRKVAAVGLASPRKKETKGFLSKSGSVVASNSARNPLSRSAPSVGKVGSRKVGTNSKQACIRSSLAVDSRRARQIRSPIIPKSMAVADSVDKRTREVKRPLAKKVVSHTLAVSIKDEGKCSGKNAKDTSLLNTSNAGTKEGPKNFLRKGAGSSRSKARGGVLQSKFGKDIDTGLKGASANSSLSSVSQTKISALGQESRHPPVECLLAQQTDDKIGTSSATYPVKISSASIGNYDDGYELAAKQESTTKGVKRKGCERTTSPSILNMSQHRQGTLKGPMSELRSTTLHGEEATVLLLSNNMQPDFCLHVEESSQSNEIHTNATLPGRKILLAPFSPPDPLINPMQTNLISFRIDPFELPGLTEAQSLASDSSTHHLGFGVSGVTRSQNVFQQSGKGDASRITSLLEQHVPTNKQHVTTNNQGKELKRFLKFGWRSTHTPAGSDPASASIFSEIDEDRGSFSEPGPKVLNCYGRKRYGSGKASSSRVSGFDRYHCSPSTPEHHESKGSKTIIFLKRSVSTHEVQNKSGDRSFSKTSAVKATRALFSLAPFRRKL